MSNYRGRAVNPSTGKEEDVDFLDDYFGKHRYGVRFYDGAILDKSQVEEVAPSVEFNEHLDSGYALKDGSGSVESNVVQRESATANPPSYGPEMIEACVQAMAEKWLDHQEDALLEQHSGEPQKPSGKWIVDIKGKPEGGDFEVSVLRADNKQGLRSYGWHGLNEKICIFSNGGPCCTRTTQEVGDRLIRLAHEVADEFNERDRNK